MQYYLEKIFGFLPQRGVLWTAIFFLISMFLIRYMTGIVMRIVELPWMKESNQIQRKLTEERNKQSR